MGKKRVRSNAEELNGLPQTGEPREGARVSACFNKVGAAPPPPERVLKNLLKRTSGLAGYPSSYENIFRENESKAGVQAGSAIANGGGQDGGGGKARGADDPGRRVSVAPGWWKRGSVRWAAFAGSGFRSEQRADDFGLGGKRKNVRLIKCTNPFQFIMQRLCVQLWFVHKINHWRSPACHDRRATVRGVHA